MKAPRKSSSLSVGAAKRSTGTVEVSRKTLLGKKISEAMEERSWEDWKRNQPVSVGKAGSRSLSANKKVRFNNDILEHNYHMGGQFQEELPDYDTHMQEGSSENIVRPEEADHQFSNNDSAGDHADHWKREDEEHHHHDIYGDTPSVLVDDEHHQNFTNSAEPIELYLLGEQQQKMFMDIVDEEAVNRAVAHADDGSDEPHQQLSVGPHHHSATNAILLPSSASREYDANNHSSAASSFFLESPQQPPTAFIAQSSIDATAAAATLEREGKSDMINDSTAAAAAAASILPSGLTISFNSQCIDHSAILPGEDQDDFDDYTDEYDADSNEVKNEMMNSSSLLHGDCNNENDAENNNNNPATHTAINTASNNDIDDHNNENENDSVFATTTGHRSKIASIDSTVVRSSAMDARNAQLVRLLRERRSSSDQLLCQLLTLIFTGGKSAGSSNPNWDKLVETRPFPPPDDCKPLFPGSKYTKGEFARKMEQYRLDYHVPTQQMRELLGILEEYVGDTVDLPVDRLSGNRLRISLADYTNPNFDRVRCEVRFDCCYYGHVVYAEENAHLTACPHPNCPEHRYYPCTKCHAPGNVLCAHMNVRTPKYYVTYRPVIGLIQRLLMSDQFLTSLQYQHAYGVEYDEDGHVLRNLAGDAKHSPLGVDARTKMHNRYKEFIADLLENNPDDIALNGEIQEVNLFGTDYYDGMNVAGEFCPDRNVWPLLLSFDSLPPSARGKLGTSSFLVCLIADHGNESVIERFLLRRCYMSEMIKLEHGVLLKVNGKRYLAQVDYSGHLFDTKALEFITECEGQHSNFGCMYCGELHGKKITILNRMVYDDSRLGLPVNHVLNTFGNNGPVAAFDYNASDGGFPPQVHPQTSRMSSSSSAAAVTTAVPLQQKQQHSSSSAVVYATEMLRLKPAESQASIIVTNAYVDDVGNNELNAHNLESSGRSRSSATLTTQQQRQSSLTSTINAGIAAAAAAAVRAGDKNAAEKDANIVGMAAIVEEVRKSTPAVDMQALPTEEAAEAFHHGPDNKRKREDQVVAMPVSSSSAMQVVENPSSSIITSLVHDKVPVSSPSSSANLNNRRPFLRSSSAPSSRAATTVDIEAATGEAISLTARTAAVNDAQQRKSVRIAGSEETSLRYQYLIEQEKKQQPATTPPAATTFTARAQQEKFGYSADDEAAETEVHNATTSSSATAGNKQRKSPTSSSKSKNSSSSTSAKNNKSSSSTNCDGVAAVYDSSKEVEIIAPPTTTLEDKRTMLQRLQANAKKANVRKVSQYLQQRPALTVIGQTTKGKAKHPGAIRSGNNSSDESDGGEEEEAEDDDDNDNQNDGDDDDGGANITGMALYLSSQTAVKGISSSKSNKRQTRKRLLDEGDRLNEMVLKSQQQHRQKLNEEPFSSSIGKGSLSKGEKKAGNNAVQIDPDVGAELDMLHALRQLKDDHPVQTCYPMFMPQRLASVDDFDLYPNLANVSEDARKILAEMIDSRFDSSVCCWYHEGFSIHDFEEFIHYDRIVIGQDKQFKRVHNATYLENGIKAEERRKTNKKAAVNGTKGVWNYAPLAHSSFPLHVHPDGLHIFSGHLKGKLLLMVGDRGAEPCLLKYCVEQNIHPTFVATNGRYCPWQISAEDVYNVQLAFTNMLFPAGQKSEYSNLSRLFTSVCHLKSMDVIRAFMCFSNLIMEHCKSMNRAYRCWFLMFGSDLQYLMHDETKELEDEMVMLERRLAETMSLHNAMFPPTELPLSNHFISSHVTQSLRAVGNIKGIMTLAGERANGVFATFVTDGGRNLVESMSAKYHEYEVGKMMTEYFTDFVEFGLFGLIVSASSADSYVHYVLNCYSSAKVTAAVNNNPALSNLHCTEKQRAAEAIGTQRDPRYLAVEINAIDSNAGEEQEDAEKKRRFVFHSMGRHYLSVDPFYAADHRPYLALASRKIAENVAVSVSAPSISSSDSNAANQKTQNLPQKHLQYLEQQLSNISVNMTEFDRHHIIKAIVTKTAHALLRESFSESEAHHRSPLLRCYHAYQFFILEFATAMIQNLVDDCFSSQQLGQATTGGSCFIFATPPPQDVWSTLVSILESDNEVWELCFFLRAIIEDKFSFENYIQLMLSPVVLSHTSVDAKEQHVNVGYQNQNNASNQGMELPRWLQERTEILTAATNLATVLWANALLEAARNSFVVILIVQQQLPTVSVDEVRRYDIGRDDDAMSVDETEEDVLSTNPRRPKQVPPSHSAATRVISLVYDAIDHERVRDISREIGVNYMEDLNVFNLLLAHRVERRPPPSTSSRRGRTKQDDVDESSSDSHHRRRTTRFAFERSFTDRYYVNVEDLKVVRHGLEVAFHRYHVSSDTDAVINGELFAGRGEKFRETSLDYKKLITHGCLSERVAKVIFRPVLFPDKEVTMYMPRSDDHLRDSWAKTGHCACWGYFTFSSRAYRLSLTFSAPVVRPSIIEANNNNNNNSSNSNNRNNHNLDRDDGDHTAVFNSHDGNKEGNKKSPSFDEILAASPDDFVNATQQGTEPSLPSSSYYLYGQCNCFWRLSNIPQQMTGVDVVCGKDYVFASVSPKSYNKGGQFNRLHCVDVTKSSRSDLFSPLFIESSDFYNTTVTCVPYDRRGRVVDLQTSGRVKGDIPTALRAELAAQKADVSYLAMFHLNPHPFKSN